MKILKGKEAKEFYNNANYELFIKPFFCDYLNKNFVGYFKESESFIAFDNRTSELWQEEFETEEQAVNYIE